MRIVSYFLNVRDIRRVDKLVPFLCVSWCPNSVLAEFQSFIISSHLNELMSLKMS